MPGSTACLCMYIETALAVLQTRRTLQGVCLHNTGVKEGTMHSLPMAAGLWDALGVPVAGPACRAQLDGLQHQASNGGWLKEEVVHLI